MPSDWLKKEEIAVTVEIRWENDIETPDWATELITVMEFLLFKLILLLEGFLTDMMQLLI